MSSPGFAQTPAPAPAPAAPKPLPSALNNGSPEEASKYYQELSTKLGLLTPATIETQATFQTLLNYLGYPELTRETVEFAAPEAMMPAAPAKPATPAGPLAPGSKVSLQADTGSYLARCNNCQPSVNNGAPDSLTAHIVNATPVPSIVFEVVDAGNGQIALKADTGKFVSRCTNCIVGGTVSDFATIHLGDATPQVFSRFTAEALPNGKIALKADTGKYMNRCRNCSPNATTADTVTLIATAPKTDVSAQWTVVTRTPAPTPPALPNPGEALVSRFFAPKIVNFADSPSARNLGWRRLVRLNARAGSDAKKHFVESAWVLFNHFTKPPTHKPFSDDRTLSSSLNTQVALITLCPSTNTQCQQEKLNSIYWLDFGKSADGARLSLKLDAFFDAGSLPGDDKSAPYFVPNGCDTCHGSLKGSAVLNYLDTDHWLDRVADGDFPVLTKPDAPAPLFDAGKDPKAAQYTTAFNVLRQLNQEISVMQERTNPKAFHLAATREWLSTHKTSVAPEPDLVKRAVAFSNTGHPLKKDRKPTSAPLDWKATTEDKELLGLMNKYCYRCHGAIRFDVFSKDMVADESSPILDRIDPNDTQKKILGFKMPVDRDLDPKDKQRLMELIEKLYNETH